MPITASISPCIGCAARADTSRPAWLFFPVMLVLAVLVAAALAIVMARPAVGQTVYDFTGGGDGVSWSDASNWTPNGVPGASDEAVVSSGVVTISGAVTVGTISLRNSGQLAFGSDPITVDSLHLGSTPSPAVAGSGTITTNKLRWNTGTVLGSTINLTGAGEVDGVSFSRVLDSATMVVSGSLQLTGRMRMTDNARLEIGLGATFDITGGADILYQNALNITQPVIVNAGTLTKLADAGQTDIQAVIENTGTVASDGGTLRFGGGGTSTGAASFVSAGGAEISFDRINPFDSAAYAIGPSSFTGGGAIDFSASATDVTLTGVYDVGTTTVTGSTVRVSAGLSLPSLGTSLSITSGSLVLDRAPDVMPEWLALSGTLETNVPLSIDSLRFASFNAVALTGPVDVTTRALSWSSGHVTLGGELIVTGNAEVAGISFSRYLNGSTLRVAGDMTLTGRMRVTDGSQIIVDPGGSLRFLNNSEISYQTAVGVPRAVLINQGLVEKDGSTGDSDVDMAIDNAGTVRSLGGRLRFAGGGSSTGTFDVATDATIAFMQLFGFSDSQYDLSAATFIGAGTINFGANATTTDINGPYEVGQTVVSGSAITFPAGAELFSLGSTVVVSSGSLTLNEAPAAMPQWANLSSTLVANVDITVADSINMSSNNEVAIGGSGNVTTRWLYWTSGVIESSGIVTAEAQVEIEGTSFQRTLRGSRLNLRGFGANGFLRGRMRVTDGAVFDLGPGTVFTLRDGADIIYQTAAVADTARIHNEGQLIVGLGLGSTGDVSNIAPIIDNYGTFGGNQTQVVLESTSRLINRESGFVVSNDVLDVRAAFEVTNRGFYSVLGNEPAAMELRGDLVIPPGGYIPILNAERARLLTVTGEVTLGGELVVVPDLGDTVQVGQTLPIIAANNVVGEFATVIDTLFSSVSFEVVYEPNLVSLRVVEKGGSDPNAPVAIDDNASVDEDNPVSIDVLANDSDPDDDALTIASVSTPANGSAVIVSGTSITYTPAQDFNGTDTFTYVATDGGLQSTPATVTVTVNPVNDAPVAADDAATTTEGVAILIDALENDTDVDGDALVISALGATSNGGAVAVESGEIRYTPATGFVGTESFSYSIEDPGTASASANVVVTVEAGSGGGPTYALTSLTSFAASVATSINDEGLAVGAARNGAGDLVAWRTQGATASEIDVPGLVESIAWDINESGTVVVSGLTADSTSEAYVVTASGNATRLTGLGGGFDIAYAITNDGAVYGVSANPDGELRGVRFLPTLTEIHNATFAASEVFGANASGDVAGALHQSGSAVPLLGSASSPQAGSGPGRAVAINAAGVSVGAIDGPSGTYAARWGVGGNPEAVTGTGGFSEALDINGAGWIVGVRGTGAGKAGSGTTSISTAHGNAEQAYVAMRQRLFGTSRDGAPTATKTDAHHSRVATEAILVTDQDELVLSAVTSAPGWTLDEARAINASGTVVGTGTFAGASQAFVLDVVSNTAPVARVDQAFAAPGESVEIAVLQNDDDIESAVRVVAVGAARFGTTRIGDDGRTVVYHPDARSGVDRFSYTIADGAGAVASSSVEVVIGMAPGTTEPYLAPAYPNPFDDSATIGLFLREEAQVSAELFDALGRRVQVLEEGVTASGALELAVAGDELGAGRYYVRVTIDGPVRYTRTAVVVRR